MSAKPKKTHKPAKHSAMDVKVGEVVGAEETHHTLDEVIDVPTGTSPLKYALMIILVIFLIAIFAINPSTFQSATRGGSESYMTWTVPGQGLSELTGSEFIQEKRKLDSLLKLFRQGNLEDSDVARYIVLADLAANSGIAVTDGELTERLRDFAEAFGGKQGLEAYMMRSPGRVTGFQETVRRKMSGDRYLQMILALASHVDPTKVEKGWRESHQEYAYDFVGIEVANLIEDALAEVPDDAALATWLAELSAGEQSQFNEPPRISAELVGFLIGGENTAVGLLARFPEVADVEVPDEAPDEATAEPADDAAASDETESEEEEASPEEGDGLAKLYYDNVFYLRFARPAPAEGEPALGIAARFLRFEEAKELAEAEAPIYFALKRWLEDVQLREAEGTPVNLALEASELGLSYLPADQAYSRPEWTTVEGWGGPRLGGRIDQLGPGELGSGLLIETGALFVARQKDRVEAYLPELAAIRDKVVAAWADQRAGEMAVERLVALRDSFAPPAEEASDDAEEASDEDAEVADAEDVNAEDVNAEDVDAEEVAAMLPSATEAEFKEAVAALGLEVARRPYMEQSMLFTLDPDKNDPGHTFIRMRSNLVDLEAGKFAEPGLNPTKERAYLIRAVGKRDPEAWRLSPGDFDQASQMAEYEAQLAFMESNLSDEAIFAEVGMELDDDEE